MKVNKFNIHWQIVRVKARQIGNVFKKIEFVLDYLFFHPNIFNYERVLNWMKMTSIAYSVGTKERDEFERTLKYLAEYKHLYSSNVDIGNDLTKVSTEDLQMVLKDLAKRKYGFQFKQVPKDHVGFVQMLENELKNR